MHKHVRAASGMALAAMVGLSGCAEFYQTLAATEAAASAGGGSGSPTQPLPPHVGVSAVRLEQAPSNQMLAAYECAQLATPFVCGLLGPLPAPSDLQFVFAVDLDVANPNAFPVPAVEILAAFTAFPDARGAQNLGATCLTFCDDPTACPQNSSNACRSDRRDIHTMDDFARASVGFLVGLADGQEQLSNLRVRTLAANATTRATVRLRVDANAMTGLIGTLAQDAMAQIQRGQQPQFAIPYRLEGTLWIDVQHFGRIAAAIPAFGGTWSLR